MLLLLATTVSYAQESFFDIQRIIALSTLTAQITLDGTATQRTPRLIENDPLARPLVMRGSAGQAAACGLGLVAVMGTSYVLHKFHHEKLSRLVLWGSVAGEGINNAHQFKQVF
jgi:hypothetical protein